jgi:hypothetical protein
MFSARARVATERPERYVKQLVDHLSHRLSTRLGADGRGVIEVERGRCTLTTEAGVLVLAAVGEDEAALQHVQSVVGRHLERFGARTGLRVEWREDGPP